MNFSDLYSPIRAVLGDTDEIVKVYPDNVLDEQVRLILLINEFDLGIEEDGSSKSFTAELTSNQKAILIFSIAKSLLAPQDSEFSYQTPVLAVRRKGGSSRLYSYVLETLDGITNGSMTVRYEGELKAFLNHAERFWEDFNRAI